MTKLKTMPKKHRFKKQLNCVLLNYKMGAGRLLLYKDQTHKIMWRYAKTNCKMV